jgi:hypothetical protein
MFQQLADFMKNKKVSILVYFAILVVLGLMIYNQIGYSLGNEPVHLSIPKKEQQNEMKETVAHFLQVAGHIRKEALKSVPEKPVTVAANM